MMPIGNLSNDGINIYGYDELNHLSTMTNSADTASYSYDPFGRRVSKTVNGAITYFIYDGDRVIEERNASGNLVAAYVYGTGIDEVLTMERGGVNYYYFQDGLDSVREITDGVGNVVKNYTYDVYGRPSPAVSAISNPYLFTGRRLDEESGIYYYRARMYDPNIGRFLQRDPLGYLDNMNLYAYCLNNSINFTDPYGLWTRLVPRYGTWGGPGWSGGNTFPPLGPVDSMDECFKKHDECYGWGQDQCYEADRKKCDTKLIECLQNLSKDPRNWPRPPKRPLTSQQYRDGATIIFIK